MTFKHKNPYIIHNSRALQEELHIFRHKLLKIIFIGLILIFLLAGNISAKNKIGVFFTGISIKTESDFFTENNLSSESNFSFGIKSLFPLSDKVFVQLEMSYNKKVFIMKYYDKLVLGALKIDEAAKFTTIDIPVLLYLPFPLSNNKQLSVVIGPILSYSLNRKHTGDYSANYGNLRASGSFEESFENQKKINFGITSGWEFQFPVKNKNFSVGFRYTQLYNRVLSNLTNVLITLDNSYSYINPDTDQVYDFNYGYFSINLGMFF